MANWHFYYPKRLSFSPDDVASGLGGSEASLVLLTRELASRGHDVSVYNAIWRPGKYDGVTWRGAWEIGTAPAPDVFVSLRFESAVIDRPAKRHLFWMLDDRPDGALHFANMHPAGLVVTSSSSQRRRLGTLGDTKQVAHVSLPIRTDDYLKSSLPSASMACLYSSMPDRGLVPLLQMWPAVRRAVPDAQLLITSGWELWGYMAEEARDQWIQCIGADALPAGVTRLGALSRFEMLKTQRSVRLGLFPSNFPEMFCLAAAELAAAGRPIIASAKEALAERVDHEVTGYLVEGDPTDTLTQKEFSNQIINCLRNDDLVDAMGASARLSSRHTDVRSVAAQWEALAAV